MGLNSNRDDSGTAGFLVYSLFEKLQLPYFIFIILQRPHGF